MIPLLVKIETDHGELICRFWVGVAVDSADGSPGRVQVHPSDSAATRLREAIEAEFPHADSLVDLNEANR